MAEEFILNEGGITVTRTRFTVPGQVYAINGITSVGVIRKSRSVGAGLLIWGLVWLIVYAAMSRDPNGGWFGFFAGMVLAVIYWTRESHILLLRTAGGEVRALEGKRAWIERVGRAVEKAIVDRADAKMIDIAPAQPGSGLDDLVRLAELHKQGFVTDEEFSAKKKQLLGL